MNQSLPVLQIRIHKLDGSISTFVQDDAEKSKQILNGFQPMEIFSRQTVFLADAHSHSAIPTSQITRIDLASEEYSKPLFESGIVEAVELGKREFETLIQNLTIRDQWKNLGEQDAFVVAFLKVEMADGQHILLTMEVGAESPQGLCELRDYILNRPGLCFRMGGGGVAVLNLANLTQLTFFPGTPEPPSDAWQVRSIDLLPLTTSPEMVSQVATPTNRQKLAIQKRL